MDVIHFRNRWQVQGCTPLQPSKLVLYFVLSFFLFRTRPACRASQRWRLSWRSTPRSPKTPELLWNTSCRWEVRTLFISRLGSIFNFPLAGISLWSCDRTHSAGLPVPLPSWHAAEWRWALWRRLGPPQRLGLLPDSRSGGRRGKAHLHSYESIYLTSNLSFDCSRVINWLKSCWVQKKKEISVPTNSWASVNLFKSNVNMF